VRSELMRSQPPANVLYFLISTAISILLGVPIHPSLLKDHAAESRELI